MTVVNSARFDFSGSVVIVTGGAGGLGAAVREGFGAAGARAIALDRAAEADVRVDVTDPAELEAVMAAVHREHGGPHVLVTLAGGSLGTPRELDAVSAADVDAVIDVNLKGTLHACRAAAPYLRSVTGSIVTCASIGARQPSPVTGVPYAAAKAAIGGLTRRLATELGADGVRVNAVAPGLVLTPRLRGMFESLTEHEREAIREAIALRRMPEPDEIVAPVMFLASRAAGYITGITLDVNGGRYMPP